MGVSEMLDGVLDPFYTMLAPGRALGNAGECTAHRDSI